MGDLTNPRLRAALAQLAPRYRVLDHIGSGSAAEVYRARRLADGARVAIKLLLVSLDSNQLDRFIQEGRLLATLNHENLVRLEEVGTADELPFLVTELMDGGSLLSWMEKTRSPPLPVVVRIIQDVLAGLAPLHSRLIIHRDIKPANILLVKGSGRAKLADLGLAKDYRRDGPETVEGSIMGTPRYMSPEQVRGEPALVASDLYAVGLILYELLSGAFPFEAANAYEMMRAQEGKPPIPLETRVAGLPRGLYGLVTRALSKRAEDRPHSADAFSQELSALLRANPAPAGRPGARWLLAGTLFAAATLALVLRQSILTEPRRLVTGPMARLGTTNLRHRYLRELGFLPTGELVSQGEGQLLIWEPSTGRLKRRVAAKAAGWNAAGNRMAVLDASTLHWLNPHAPDKVLGQPIPLLGSDARSLFIDETNSTCWISFTGGRLIRLAPGHGEGAPLETGRPVRRLSGRPGGRWLALHHDDNSLSIWDTSSSRITGVIPPRLPGTPNPVAFFADGRRMVAGGPEGLWIYECEHVTRERILRATPGAVAQLAVDPKGELLALRSPDDGLRILDLETTYSRVHIHIGKAAGHAELAFSPDSKLLAVAGPGARITLVNVQTGQYVSPDDEPEEPARLLATSAAAEVTATVHRWGQVRLQAKGRLRTIPLPPKPLGGLVLPESGQRLGVLVPGESLLWFDTASGQSLARVTQLPAGAQLLASSADRIFIAGTDKLNSYRILATQPESSVPLPPAVPRRLVTAKKRVALLQASGAVQLIDLDPPQVHSLPSAPWARDLALSEDGQLLAIVAREVVEVWNTATGQRALEIREPGVPYTTAVFSEGALALGTLGGLLRFHALDGTPRLRIRAHTGAIDLMVRSHDGRTLVTAGTDTTIALWRVADLLGLDRSTHQVPQVIETPEEPPHSSR